MSRQTIVAIEAGDYAPSVYLALTLAEVLGESVEALFGTAAQQEPGNASAASDTTSNGRSSR